MRRNIWNADQFIAARIPSETKMRLRALAERQQLSESALLKRLVDLMLQTAGVRRRYRDGSPLALVRMDQERLTEIHSVS